MFFLGGNSFQLLHAVAPKCDLTFLFSVHQQIPPNLNTVRNNGLGTEVVNKR